MIYQVKKQHDFNGDAEGAVADAQDHIGQDGSSKSQVSGHGHRHVDQEQN